MRDPDSTIELGSKFVTRRFRSPISHDHFLRSALAKDWVDAGWMIAFELIDDHQLRAPRLPFVTQPTEWCDAQFHDAAALTLQLATAATMSSFDFKDASVWNIIFDGTVPRLCDHGSVLVLGAKEWWAAGQFGRHFLLPLLLSRKRGLRAHHALAIWRDGVPASAAAQMFGVARYLTRYWPLMAAPRRKLPLPDNRRQDPEAPTIMVERSQHRFRTGLYAGLEFMLGGVRADSPRSGSTWSHYTTQRHHYPPVANAAKRHQVTRWLTETRPAWTLDLGCNTGEFSELALEAGSSVVALDGDHDSVQAMYLRMKPSARIYPVIADLDDISAGRGWEGKEHDGLAQRLVGAFDMVLMLALIHHLAVGAAIPLCRIAEFARSTTRRWLVLEIIESTDQQLRQLCTERHRQPEEFSAMSQCRAFTDAGFQVRQRHGLPGGERSLLLLERSDG